VAAPVNVVIFDRHDDFCDPLCGLPRLQQLLQVGLNERVLSDIVEWELSRNDDDWIKTGMHLGYIADILLVGVEDDHNVDTSCNANGVFVDMNGNNHVVRSVGHIWDGLDYQGWIFDFAQRAAFEPCWKILGWNPKERQFNPERDLIVDIDLDCFSSDSWGQTLSIRADLFTHLLSKKVPHSGMSAATWLCDCIAAAKYVGIATESTHCGGYYEMMKSLHTLDHVLFEEHIGRQF
jgi:hypothetical protein